MRIHWTVGLLPLMAGICLVLAFFSTSYLALKVFPEVGMVLKSQCSNPTPSWNGKILEFQVWKNSFETDSKYNTYKDTTADRRLQALRYEEEEVVSRLLKGNRTKKRNRKKKKEGDTGGAESKSLSGKISATFKEFQSHTVNDYNEYPLILWGSHHKTGTYLAQKIFAVMCAQMKWCCVYHVTRDSIHSIRKSLQSEPVHLLGHTQWIWLPEELGIPYKFIHLYRHPYKKIISGYRYHMEGAEAWCKQPLYYNRSCEFLQRTSQVSQEAVLRAQRLESFVDAKKSKRAKKKRRQQANAAVGALVEVDRNAVQSYCKSIHLCEPCCRREHELPQVAATATINSRPAAVHFEEIQTAGSAHIDSKRKYALRGRQEYAFMCDNLMQVNVSLMETLNTVPTIEGLRVEAAVDYYESLRMARIINHTRSDPESLNIDLDKFMGNYADTVSTIMNFLNLPITEEVKASLLESMQFYDISSSYYYRLVMTNPLTNHVDTKRAEVQEDMMTLIKQDESIDSLYSPILDMMS